MNFGDTIDLTSEQYKPWYTNNERFKYPKVNLTKSDRTQVNGEYGVPVYGNYKKGAAYSEKSKYNEAFMNGAEGFTVFDENYDGPDYSDMYTDPYGDWINSNKPTYPQGFKKQTPKNPYNYWKPTIPNNPNAYAMRNQTMGQTNARFKKQFQQNAPNYINGTYPTFVHKCNSVNNVGDVEFIEPELNDQLRNEICEYNKFDSQDSYETTVKDGLFESFDNNNNRSFLSKIIRKEAATNGPESTESLLNDIKKSVDTIVYLLIAIILLVIFYVIITKILNNGKKSKYISNNINT